MFDQGLLGAAFLYLAVWYVLRRATVPAGEAVTVLVLATVNGLSVSAFNSVFVILVVAICVALVRDGDAAAGAAPAVPIRDRRADRAHRGGRL